MNKGNKLIDKKKAERGRDFEMMEKKEKSKNKSNKFDSPQPKLRNALWGLQY